MTQQTVSIHCPTCFKEVDQSRFINPSLYVCDCGWTYSGEAIKKNQSNNRNIVLSMALFSFLLVGSIIHGIKWNQYSLSVIPIQVKKLIGNADTKDYSKLVEICKERLNHDCVEEAYMEIYRIDPNNGEALTQLAKLQSQRGHQEAGQQEKLQLSANNFSIYFDRGGKDYDAAYEFAKVLTTLKKYTEAEKYFKYVIKAKPKVLQTTVTRAYAQMLLEDRQFAKAKQVIKEYRSRGDNAVYFMASELNEINKKLNKKTSNLSKL